MIKKIDEGKYGNPKARPILYEETENGCWHCVSHDARLYGYSLITRHKMHKGQMYMHRYIYTLFKGEIPKGKVIRHSCDNKSCINPDHLLLGTQAQNVQELIRIGAGTVKLTPEQALDIYKSEKPIQQLANEYGVGYTCVHKIKTGVTWSSITGHNKQAN